MVTQTSEQELTDEQLAEISGGAHHHFPGFGFGRFGFGLGLGLGLGGPLGLGYGYPDVVQVAPPVEVVQPTTQVVGANGQTYELVAVG